MNFHFQYGGLKPEVVIYPFLLKYLEKFRRLDTCSPARSFKRTCRRHHPTSPDNARHPKKQYDGWKTGSSYIYTSSQDILAISVSRIMVTCTAIPANTSSIKYNNAQHHKSQIWRRKYGNNQLLASVLDFLVWDVVRRCGAHVHWNGHVRKHAPSL